jgi:hypothetical protein
MVSPSRRRDAVTFLCRRHPVSQRRACRLLDQHRSTQRYLAQPAAFEVALVARMNELAAEFPRWGYRKIWMLLRDEGFMVNKKRIERLWRLEGHRVPAQKKTHGQKAVGGSGGSTWNVQAERPNGIWSYDFVSARTDDGGRCGFSTLSMNTPGAALAFTLRAASARAWFARSSRACLSATAARS